MPRFVGRSTGSEIARRIVSLTIHRAQRIMRIDEEAS